MEGRAVARGRGLTAAAVLGTAVVAVAFAVMLLRRRPLEEYYDLFLFQNGPSTVALLWMGRLVLRRQPANAAGRVLLAIGTVQVLHVAVASVAHARLLAAGVTLRQAAAGVQADLPLDAAVPLWVMNWLWVPAPVLTITLLVLVFPDGRLSGVPWRPPVVTAAAGSALLMVAFGIDAWPTSTWTAAEAPAVVPALLVCGGLAVAAAATASIVILVRRWRHAGAARRQQYRIVGVALIVFAVVGIATYPWQPVWIPSILVTFNALIVVYALAIARYRLHDLEPVLGRAAVAAILTGLIAAVYVAVVAGLGHLLGRSVDSRILPLVAVAVVALLAEPARRRTRRLVDRMLYGRDTDRTEVLSRLAAQASTAPAADVLREVAQLLVRSTGAARAEVWLDSGTSQPAAVAGASTVDASPTLSTPVTNQGERFGELRLYAHAPADLAADAARLLDDVAHALGVVLRNDRLAADLRRQLDQLRDSRQRLVTAHDRARRGLERDIHDGAQARLISLRLRVGTMRARAGSTDTRLADELDALGREVDAAVRALRSLARGVYPPILEQDGLPAALRAYARELSVPVAVTARGVGRYPRAAEAAVYFACMEAVQNAIRHGGCTAITVDLDGEDHHLRFQVGDDGTGFDPATVPAGSGLTNIDDRVSALGGSTRVQSAPGAGTRITGEIPAQRLVEER